MNSNEVPEPWASRMVERGFSDPRYTDDRPSMSKLGAHVGIHTSTISSAIHGRRRASAATVRALVDALGADVAEWLGVQAASAWTPPAESSLLTDRQRRAVEEIIRAMAEHRQEVGDHDQRSAPKTQPAHLRGIPNHHDDDQGEDPPMPDFTQLAARSGRGVSEAERLAQQQDDESETP